MREMARRPEKDRRDLFRAAAQKMDVHEAIVEKDFWVCWVLDYLFQESPWRDHSQAESTVRTIAEERTLWEKAILRARYKEAKPGSLRLLPPEHHAAELQKDYQSMRAMLFGQVPTFEEIVTELAALERQINQSTVLKKG